MEQQVGKTYSHCRLCGELSEKGPGDTGLQRHHPLCEPVRSLQHELARLRDALMAAGLTPEERP